MRCPPLALAALIAAQCLIWNAPLRAEDTAGRHLVAVANVTSKLGHFTTAQLRRAYLGAPMPKEVPPFRALVNRSDGQSYEMFLQKVLYMSDQAFERYVSQKQSGGDNAGRTIYRSEAKLLARLRADPRALTVVSDKVAAQAPFLKVLTRL